MRGKILAKLPEDAGKKIYCGVYSVTVTAQDICYCGAAADVLIQGETDSHGFEVDVYCNPCLERSKAREKIYTEALDVDDHLPKDGHIFLVSEMTNYDGHGEWTEVFTSFRDATKFYRKIDRIAERWGGLYPGQGVREVSEKQALERVKAEREWHESLCYEDDYEDEDYEE